MKEKTLDELIQDFKDYRGEKSFHISNGSTEYPGTKNEKHTPTKIVKGPINWDNCKLCQEPLKPLKKENPKRRLRKYCSPECRNEHDEIKKIKKKLGAEFIMWPPQKPPIPKELLTYTLPGHNGKQFKYRARKLVKNS